jgi:hypothetical protein
VHVRLQSIVDKREQIFLIDQITIFSFIKYLYRQMKDKPIIIPASLFGKLKLLIFPLIQSDGFLYFIGIVIAWIAVVLGFVFTPGYQAILRDEYYPKPEIKTCSVGSCWDGAIKHQYPLCTVALTATNVLGVVLQPGETTCYKSIYYNLEGNAALAYFVYASFAAFVARAVEYLLKLIINKRFRWFFLLPAVCNYFSFYYS